MPQTIEDLGVKVKAKYPGQYDDLSNAELGQKVKAKYPGAYNDFIDASTAVSPTLLASRQETSKQVVNVASEPANTWQNRLLSGLEGLGVDAQNPVTGTAKNLASGFYKLITSKPNEGDYFSPEMHSLVASPWEAHKTIAEGAAENDPQKVMRGIGQFTAAITPVIAGVKGATEGIGEAAANSAEPLMMRAADLKAKMATSRASAVIPLSKFAVAKEAARAVLNATRAPRVSLYEAAAKAFADKQSPVISTETPAIIRNDVPIANPPLSTPDALFKPPAAATPVESQIPMPNPPPEELSPFALQLKKHAVPSEPIPMPNPPTVGSPHPVTVRDITTAEQALRPVGTGQRSAMFNVPKLLNEVPELVGIRKGPNFDAKLSDAFTQREAGVIQAEANVPRETTVPNPADKLAEIKTEYDADPHMQGTAAKLGKMIEQWEALPDQVPWEQFRDAKRSFFEENSTRSAPMRRAYGALMEAVKGISPELDAANQSYSVVRRAMDDANMETSSKVIEGQPVRGRRIKDVGKTAKPTVAEQLRQSQPLPPASTPPSSAPLAAPPMEAAPPSIPLSERTAMFRESAAGKVGAALPPESRGLSQMIDARFAQIRDAARSGVTDTTGKALGKSGPEAGSANAWNGGGILNAFPELKNLGATPAQIAEAIDRGSGVVYERVRKAVSDAMQAARESRPGSGPEPLSVRARRVFDLRRQASSEAPF